MDAQKGADVTLPTGHLYELWPSDSLQERIRSLVFMVQMSCGPWPQRYDKSWQPAQDRHTTLTETDKNVRWLKSFPQRAAQEDFCPLCHLPQKLDLMDCVNLDTFHSFIHHLLQWIGKVSHTSISSPLYQHCSSNRILIQGKFAKWLWCRQDLLIYVIMRESWPDRIRDICVKYSWYHTLKAQAVETKAE